MAEKREMHPIVKGLSPSPEQIPAILSRDVDIAVTAGAGTGKTRTLVARYLSLLTEGVPLGSIVAITFTNKAAREMRNRVREEVRTYLLSGELPPDERRAWRSVYEDLDGARISTIHSLAGDILRQHPAELGLDPGFETLDENQAAQLKAQAVEAALAWAGSDSQASSLFTVIGAWKLRRVLAGLLNRRLDLAAALADLPEDLWSIWQPHLIAPIRAFLEDPTVRGGLDELQALKYDGALERAQEAGDQLVDYLRVVIKCWEEIKLALADGDWIRVSRLTGELGSNLKQKGRTQNWEPAQPKRVIKEIQSIYSDLIGRTELDFAVDRQLAQQVVPALRSLFQYADQWYAEARAQANSLDFDDLEQKVLQLLGNHPQVLEYWQGVVQALLVDEYQDTNGRQRELVNYLNGGGRSLFIVGDGKQSIYRFRGADVAVFREEQKRVAAEGESYQLDRSYRPHPTLLDDLNTLLGPVLGDRDDLPYLEPFAPLTPGRRSSPVIDLPAYVEVHLAAGSRSGGAGRMAAEAVACRLLELIPRDPDQDPTQLSFGDVAVLCRASRSFTDFERAFDAAGIPYTTVSGQGFFDRPEVRDVLNAMRVFADPDNDLALAGLLRSPVIGFDDQILFDLREHQRNQGLGSLLEGIKDLASGDEGSELRDFWVLVEEFSNLAGKVTAAELISRFLERTNYGAGLLLAGQDRALGNLHKLVLDAQSSGLVNLTDFLSAVEEIQNVAIREGEAQSVAQGAVQIMTVHQAKGLEFPVVILGDAAKRERFNRDLLIDERFGLIPPFSLTYLEENPGKTPTIRSGRSTAYEIALESERLKEEAESKRLLYVAATRAQDLLLLSGAVGNPTKAGKLPKLAGWMGELAGPLGILDWDPILDPEGAAIHHRTERSEGLGVELYIYENKVEFGNHRPPDQKGLHRSPEEIRALWNKLDQGILPEPAAGEGFDEIFPASRSGSTAHVPHQIIGDVVHRALELWKFPADGESPFLSWLEVELKRAGIYHPEALQAGYRRVRRILDRFYGSDLYQRMSQAEIILREAPYHLQGADGSVQSGAIDVLFLEGDEWVLVDYKTDQIKAGQSVDWEGTDYHEQIQGYLDAAQQLLGIRAHPILCFLDFGGAIKLVTDRWNQP